MEDSKRSIDSGEADAGVSDSARPENHSHYPDPDIDNPEEPRCPLCGGAITQSDVICPHCGESLVAG